MQSLYGSSFQPVDIQEGESSAFSAYTVNIHLWTRREGYAVSAELHLWGEGFFILPSFWGSGVFDMLACVNIHIHLGLHSLRDFSAFNTQYNIQGLRYCFSSKFSSHEHFLLSLSLLVAVSAESTQPSCHIVASSLYQLILEALQN